MIVMVNVEKNCDRNETLFFCTNRGTNKEIYENHYVERWVIEKVSANTEDHEKQRTWDSTLLD